MNFAEIMKLLLAENNGWVSIIIIVSIVVFYILVDKKVIFQGKKTEKKIDDGFQKMSDTLAAQNKTLIDSIVDIQKQTEQHNVERFEKTADIIKEILVTRDSDMVKSHESRMNYRFDIADTINDEIKNLLTYYHADRVELIEFHNSKENLNGLSFLWYDVQYQQTASTSIKPVAIVSHPLNNIAPMLRELSADDDNIVIYDDEKVDELAKNWPIVIYYIRENVGANNIIMSGILDNNNHLIGFISVDYLTTPMKKELIDTRYLYDVTLQISKLLKYDGKGDDYK